MSSIHFFTDKTKLSNQNLQDSFGVQLDIGNDEVYNLQNEFSILTNSPLYAITKSQIIFLEDSNDSNVLNVVLKPLSSFTAGFPIKYFIYKGVDRNSILDSQGNILNNYSGWNSDNILKIVKDTQDKINNEFGTNDIANLESLGIHFSSLPNSTFLDSIFLDQTDEFHPLIVDGGCQIGKLLGGTNKIAIQVVFDVISADLKVSDVRNFQSKFLIEKVDFNLITNPLVLLEEKFKNRFKKEVILNYLDITSFYGSCRNQGFKIQGLTIDDTFLDKFYNKNVIYIDVRDSWGYSYNHFIENNDELKFGVFNANDEIVEENLNIYLDWPIIKVTNKAYLNNKKEFYISLPVNIGAPEQERFIVSFNSSDISTEKRSFRKRNTILTEKIGFSGVSLNFTERIRFQNWSYSDDKLGSCYFLTKVAEVKKNSEFLWDNVFSLKMKNIFSIPSSLGEFFLKLYSPINSPILYDSNTGEVYLPNLGVVYDKEHVTFFSVKNDIIYNQCPDLGVKSLVSGKFNPQIDLSLYDLGSVTNPNIGFINQIIGHFYENEDYKNFEVRKFMFNNSEESDINDDLSFLGFCKNDVEAKNPILESAETITLSHMEYSQIMNLIESDSYTNQDYFIEHPVFIKGINIIETKYPSFSLNQIELSLGVAKIIAYQNDNALLYSIKIEDFPDEILVNNEKIEFTSIISEKL